MRRLILAAAVLIASVFLVASSTNDAEAQAQPNPTTCEGYPEKRVYLENQSWIARKPAPVNVGEFQHIHMGTCFPLHQTLSGDTLELDIKLDLHNMQGMKLLVLITRAYQVSGGPEVFNYAPVRPPVCNTVDCTTWVHIDLPLTGSLESGPTNLQILLQAEVQATNPTIHWYNLNRWFLYLDNGHPANTIDQLRIGGDSWLTGPGTNYAEVKILPGTNGVHQPGGPFTDFPWDFETGEFIPVSGNWRPTIRFDRPGRALAMVDPHLHAQPADMGTVIFDAPGASVAGKKTLDVDTTQFSNGLHRLVVASCSETAQGGNFVNCGVQVIPFLVDNGEDPDIEMVPGEELLVACETGLTVVTTPTRATLTCVG